MSEKRHVSRREFMRISAFSTVGAVLVACGGAAPAEAPAAAEAEDEDEVLSSEPWIDTIRCTSCDECTTINNKMFAYNEDGLAYIADPRAGTFRQLVEAAEKCAPSIIHPGEPLNPDEKGLEQLIKRAEPFN